MMRRAHVAVQLASVVVETFRNGLIQKSRQTVAVGIWPVGLWRIASRPNQETNGGTKTGFTDIRSRKYCLSRLLAVFYCWFEPHKDSFHNRPSIADPSPDFDACKQASARNAEAMAVRPAATCPASRRWRKPRLGDPHCSIVEIFPNWWFSYLTTTGRNGAASSCLVMSPSWKL